MVSVILACGGNSTRMGGINKLLLKLDGITVIERTMLEFCKVKAVDELIVCSSEAFKDELLRTMTSEIPITLKFAPNGETRQKSVSNGFAMCDSQCRLVCVHDGARPLVTKEIIESAIEDALKYSCAVVCVPCKDTIKVSDANATIVETPPRNRLFMTQTPQIFEYDKYHEAVVFAEKCGFDFTDDSQLFEAMGIMPHITIGDYGNIKITTPEDIAVAQQILMQRGRKG